MAFGLAGMASAVPAKPPPAWDPVGIPCPTPEIPQLVKACQSVRVAEEFKTSAGTSEWLAPAPGSGGPLLLEGREVGHFGTMSPVWRGRVKGDPYSEVVFARGGSTVVGRISTSTGRTLRLRTTPAGIAVVEEINFDRSPLTLAVEPMTHTSGSPPGVNSIPEKCQPSPITAIRVLVVFSTEAQRQLGPDFKLWGDVAMSDTNQSLLNSDVGVQVTATKYVGVRFQEGPRLSNDHDALLGGRVPGVARERRRTGSDIVVLVVGGTEMGGQALTLQQENVGSPEGWVSRAQAVVSAETLMSTYVFTHELGHLFGAAHDSGSSSGAKGAFTYSYGHVQPVTKSPQGPWRTVMSLKDNCSRCVSRLFWSSPELDVYEEAMGDASSENNAATIRKTAPMVAQLHCYLDP